MKVVITVGFMVLDFVTGMVASIKNKEFNSSVMRNGGFNKLGSLCAIVLGLAIDYGQQFLDLGFNVPVTTAICIYITGMEIGSNIENIGRINSRLLPEKLKSIFIKLQGDDKK